MTNMQWVDGPPDTRIRKYQTEMDAVKAKPGEWALFSNVGTGMAASFRQAGFEVSTRGVTKSPKGFRELYVLWPAEKAS